jgi:hypothetical protein
LKLYNVAVSHGLRLKQQQVENKMVNQDSLVDGKELQYVRFYKEKET